MTWSYKIIKANDHYELVEYYPDVGDALARDGVETTGAKDAYTEPLLVGDSKKDIHRQLLMMLIDTL